MLTQYSDAVKSESAFLELATVVDVKPENVPGYYSGDKFIYSIQDPSLRFYPEQRWQSESQASRRHQVPGTKNSTNVPPIISGFDYQSGFDLSDVTNCPFLSINNPGIPNATPIIILTLLAYQDRIAQLSWTSSDTSVQGTYYVERMDASGWVVIKQLPYDTLLQYNDTISFPYCKASTIKYQIRFISLLDNITSSTEGVLLSDQTSPADVLNLNVDMGFSPGVFCPRISWDRITNDSISRYYIQRFDGFSWITKDSVPAGTSVYFDESASPACGSSFKYVVLAYDRCGNSSDRQLYDDYAVQTIKLDVAMPGNCDKTATLSWNPYIHMPGGISGYKIYRSNGSTSVLIKDTLATTFVDNFNFENGTSYGYSVKAYSNSSIYSSSSCEVFQQYIGVTEIDSVYIAQVSVEDDININVSYFFSPPGSADTLILERSGDGLTNFIAIGTLQGNVPESFHFTDTTADVHSKAYYYRLVAIDKCGHREFSWNVSNSIWLSCNSSSSQNNLDWNSYAKWLQGVEEYKVYRITDGQASTIEMIGNVPPATLSFPDLLTGVDPTKPVCYWVEANEKPLNPYLTDAVSKSNTCCIIKESVLFLPDAFRPNGTNNRFRPVPKPLYVDQQSFKMTIFNKWGQQLFETADMVNGWDGTLNGQDAPASLYTYIISYKSPEGKEYTKRGSFTLVR